MQKNGDILCQNKQIIFKSVLIGGLLVTENIKEIAERLEVTPQRIYQIISNLKDEKKPKYNSNGRLVVDENLIKQIEKYFSNGLKSDTSIGEGNEQLLALKLKVNELEKTLEDTKKSLEIANAKDDESKKLLDQQQQLQLESMKMVKELENRLKDLPQPKTKESWWKRVFG